MKKYLKILPMSLLCAALAACKPTETTVTPKPPEPMNVKLVQPRKGDVNEAVLPAAREVQKTLRGAGLRGAP